MIIMLQWPEAESVLSQDYDYLSYMGQEEMVAFLEDGEVIGTALLFFNDRELYIGNIDASVERHGYGRKMLEYLKGMDSIDTITGEAADFVTGFFQKMGAVFGEYDRCVEGFTFIIHCAKPIGVNNY